MAAEITYHTLRLLLRCQFKIDIQTFQFVTLGLNLIYITMVREDQPGNKIIVAYLVPRPNAAIEMTGVRQQFLENTHLIDAMGKKSEEIMIAHTPAKATQSFIQALKFIIN